MTTERAKAFQAKLTRKAIALMVIHGEPVCAASEEDVSVACFEEAIALIGMVWKLPAEVTDENLDLIRRERDVLREIAAGGDAAHVLSARELPTHAPGMETVRTVWSLYETATDVDNGEQRSVLLRLAGKLARSYDLRDWFEIPSTEWAPPGIAIS